MQSRLKLFAPSLLFIALVLLCLPFHRALEYDGDEGVNLMKALLYQNGYSLYGEIWSDQPPFLTYLLAQWMRLFGNTLFAARLLILFFAGSIVFCLIHLCAPRRHLITCLMVPLLLVFADQFLRLSVAVMIGLPSLALALISIALLVEREVRIPLWRIALSAIIMALALQTKLSAAITIAPALMMLGCNSYRRALLWFAIAFATWLLVGLLFGESLLQQMVLPHWQARESTLLTRRLHLFMEMLRADSKLLIASLLAAFLLAIRREKNALPPLIWVGIALIVLATHAPLWPHHYMLLLLPACWLLGLGIEQTVQKATYRQPLSQLAAIAFLLALSGTLLHLPQMIARSKQQTLVEFPVECQRLIHQLADNSALDQWVITDRPIFAFYANRLIPPPLAVATRKRIATGNLDLADLVAAVKEYHPAVILCSRHTLYLEPLAQWLLEENYQLLEEAYVPFRPLQGQTLTTKLFTPSDTKSIR
jgi:4-amino-4-deoxy-L-arabinose transferase-like glycosyltransferase